MASRGASDKPESSLAPTDVPSCCERAVGRDIADVVKLLSITFPPTHDHQTVVA